MAHGQPDFSTTAPKTTVYSLVDLGELAARLGSIVTHDRRGDVVLLDDFESGLEGWEIITNGANSAVALTSTRYRSGGFSIKLVTGAVNGNYASIRRHVPYPVTGRFGYELSWASGSTPFYHGFNIGFYTGTTLYRGIIEYVPSTGGIRYTSGGGTTYFGTPGLVLSTSLFNVLKVVIDMEGRNYVRCILNETEYSLADIALQSSASGASPHMYVDYLIYTTAGAKTVYVDDAIITQNEPG